MANEPDQELVVKVGADLTDLQKGMAQAGTIVEQSAGAMAKSTVSSAGVVSKEWQRSAQSVGDTWKSTWQGVAKASTEPITMMDRHVGLLQKRFLALAATVGGLSAIKSALEFGDELNKTSDRLGIATDKLQAFQYSARFFGLGAGEVTTMLERMNATIGRAVTEGGESAEVFNRLGISLSNIAGLRVDEQYSAIAEAISKLPTPGLQAAAANEIFARSGFRMIEMLKGGKTSLSEAEKELASFGGTINGISAAKLEEANDSIERMAESFKAASRVLAISLAPNIITITKLFKGMFVELNKGSNSDFFPVMNRAFVILLGTGAEVVSMFKNAWIAISSVVKLVSTIPDLLTGNLENAEKKVEEIGSAFESTKMVGEAFSGVLDTHRKSLDEIVKLEQEAAAQTKESLGTRKEDVAEIIKAREAGAARKEQEKEAARALKEQVEYTKKVNEEMANRQISLRIGESGARYLKEYAELQKAAAALQVQAAAADAELQRLLAPKAPGRGIQMELPGSEGQTVNINQIKAIKEFNEAKAALDRAYAASVLKSNDAIAEGEALSYKQREQAIIDFYAGQVGKEAEKDAVIKRLNDEKLARLGNKDAERLAEINNHYNLLLARVKAYEDTGVLLHADAEAAKKKIDEDMQKETAEAQTTTKRDYLASIRDQQTQTSETWKSGLDGQLSVTQQYAQATAGIFGNLAAAMDTHSRKGFETWKAMATAQAIVDTIASAVAAFKSMAGIPYVGVALGLAAAAAALAAGYANVRRIQATKFGDKNPPGGSGYGGTPVGSSAGGGAGNGGNESSQGERRTSTYNISITGSMFGRDQMRALLDQLRSTQADSGNVYNVSYNN